MLIIAISWKTRGSEWGAMCPRAGRLGRHIDTQVSIPDGALRTVPMASLLDGPKFLGIQ